MSQACNGLNGRESSFAERVLHITDERKGKEQLNISLESGIAIGTTKSFIVVYVDTDIYDTTKIPSDKFFFSSTLRLAEFACYDHKDLGLLLEALEEKNPMIERDSCKFSNGIKSHSC